MGPREDASARGLIKSKDEALLWEGICPVHLTCAWSRWYLDQNGGVWGEEEEGKGEAEVPGGVREGDGGDDGNGNQAAEKSVIGMNEEDKDNVAPSLLEAENSPLPTQPQTPLPKRPTLEELEAAYVAEEARQAAVLLENYQLEARVARLKKELDWERKEAELLEALAERLRANNPLRKAKSLLGMLEEMKKLGAGK